MQKSMVRLRPFDSLRSLRAVLSEVEGRSPLTLSRVEGSKFKNFRFSVLISLFAICVLNFAGCVSVPTREALPTYFLNGTNYLSLSSLCKVRGLDWDFDTFTRRITLNKDNHRINLMAGERDVLVDGLSQHLEHPVDIYKGEVVVPDKFKTEVLDVLFKKSYEHPLGQAALSKIKKVVIDAGHGGNDPGAIGKTGLREKDVVLDIARKLSQLFSENGIEVVMIRSHDTFITLEQRAKIANRSGADLFLSIHANANRVRWLNGLEVYYVSPYIDDDKRAMQAAQNLDLDLNRASFTDASLNLKATLWDMLYTYNRAESISLAYFLCDSMRHSLNIKILGVKAAGFSVLKGTQMPAVLIEVGFLSNNDEECLLRNSYYRQQVADAIFQGTRDYARESGLTKFVQR
jgi:N-acetylmuramoyl-L-alanine amidase